MCPRWRPARSLTTGAVGMAIAAMFASGNVQGGQIDAVLVRGGSNIIIGPVDGVFEFRDADGQGGECTVVEMLLQPY
jgi:hypothetical protein